MMCPHCGQSEQQYQTNIWVNLLNMFVSNMFPNTSQEGEGPPWGAVTETPCNNIIDEQDFQKYWTWIQRRKLMVKMYEGQLFLKLKRASLTVVRM